MRLLLISFGILLLSACKGSTKESVQPLAIDPAPYQAISLLGDTLRPSPPSEVLLQKLEGKKTNYQNDPSLHNLIWFGRFTAYSGAYKSAIEIYTNGLNDFPEESRLLRHRGHRYISIRKFRAAIDDLSMAAELIEGKENSIEEDGMPNERNIPVSSKHGNIYYHLGLAYYLNHDFPNALKAYQKCLATSNNPDNVVSATHWIYMILRRMGEKDEADQYLEAISEGMDVIENMAYHNACLLYKGVIDISELTGNEEEKATPSSSALKYAIGNWYFYNGDKIKARQIFESITAGDDWASFGYIAAEADLAGSF